LNRDIAHNELYHSKETDGTHKVYGWFDYRYNGRLVTAIIYNVDHETGGSSTVEEFQEWKTNGAVTSTEFTSMESAAEYDSIMQSLFKVSTETYQTKPKEKISFESNPIPRSQITKSYFYTDNEPINKNCALTEYGQVIHHSIGRDIVTDIKIKNEFVQIDSTNTKLEPVETDTIVPIDMTYYMNYNKFMGGQLIAQNGFISFDYKALHVPTVSSPDPDKVATDDSYRVNLDENSITYKFKVEYSHQGAGRKYLSLQIQNTYDVVYDGENYFKFVGLYNITEDKEGNVTETLLSTERYFDFTSIPVGTTVARYIRVIPLSIFITSGGSANVEVD
jgi:hypothetical protein